MRAHESGSAAVVRCKFKCVGIEKFLSYDQRTLYKARFSPVTSGSEENKVFYDATPAGSLEFATIAQMPFEIGREYYLDVIPAFGEVTAVV